MAGIGFVIRKLARQDNLLGPLQAYIHATLATAGPWILTIVTLSLINVIAASGGHDARLEPFRLVIMYNFAFSLCAAAPLSVLVTRYLADVIHQNRLELVPGLLVTALFLLFVILLLPVSAFFLWHVELPPALALSAVLNFLVISGIWIAIVFVSALREYRVVTRAFTAGCVIIVGLAWISIPKFGSLGALNAFTLGTVVILAVLLSRVLGEFPYQLQIPHSLWGQCRRHWRLALGAACYGAAIWVDKWVMWFAPEASRSASGFVSYPAYDSAMFLAQLTVLPVMAIFLLAVETDFFEDYVRFYEDIRRHAGLKTIEENHARLLRGIGGNWRQYLKIQLCISAVIILAAPQIFQTLGIEFVELAMFRFGVLGALFLVLTLFITIYLSYFDNITEVVAVQLLLLVSNAFFSYLTRGLGFPFYGFGFFLATLLSFTVAALLAYRYIRDLPYHTFITRNLTRNQKWLELGETA